MSFSRSISRMWNGWLIDMSPMKDGDLPLVHDGWEWREFDESTFGVLLDSKPLLDWEVIILVEHGILDPKFAEPAALR